MMLLASQRLLALTRGQFDNWEKSRQNKYLKQHPNSSFHDKNGSKPDGHRTRLKRHDEGHYGFTDNSGKHHQYKSADDIEEGLDKLHGQMDKLAKRYHGADGIEQGHIRRKMADLSDHGKALQDLAKNKTSNKELGFGKNNLAQHGLDTVEQYLKFHKPKGKPAAKKPAAKKGPPWGDKSPPYHKAGDKYDAHGDKAMYHPGDEDDFADELHPEDAKTFKSLSPKVQQKMILDQKSKGLRFKDAFYDNLPASKKGPAPKPVPAPPKARKPKAPAVKRKGPDRHSEEPEDGSEPDDGLKPGGTQERDTRKPGESHEDAAMRHYNDADNAVANIPGAGNRQYNRRHILDLRDQAVEDGDHKAKAQLDKALESWDKAKYHDDEYMKERQAKKQPKKSDDDFDF